MKKTLSFLGCGNMASAIIHGAGGFDICVFDKDKSKYEKFTGERFTHGQTVSQAVECGNYIFLCVKPQNVDELLPTVAGCDLSGKVIVTIMAGVTIERICSYLGADVAVIRTMPNTPLMLGKGVTALCRNEAVTDRQFSDICRLFSGMGEVIVTTQDKINAVTSATSSAPAYVYLFIKAIADEAVKEGLEYDNIVEIITRMVIGSCHMVLESGKTPDELIKMVTSPNGTTQRAMEVFEKADFCNIIARAMQACAERAKELSGE